MPVSVLTPYGNIAHPIRSSVQRTTFVCSAGVTYKVYTTFCSATLLQASQQTRMRLNILSQGSLL
jgi:hypothetical protein